MVCGTLLPTLSILRGRPVSRWLLLPLSKGNVRWSGATSFLVVSSLLETRVGQGAGCCGMSAGRGGGVGMDVGVVHVGDGGGLIDGGSDGVNSGGSGVVSIGAAGGSDCRGKEDGEECGEK